MTHSAHRFHRPLYITAAIFCSCCQHLQTARRKTCWSSSVTFPSATKVSLSLDLTEGRKEGRKVSRFSVLMAASLFQGHSYNFPVLLWLMDSFPITPPICFLRPTSNMVIREGKHVDARGRLFLPGLHNWDYVGLREKVIHKVISPSNWPNFYFVALFKPKSSVVGLLNEMTAKFAEEPPLSSKATVENKDPHELLAFVSNLQINDGTPSDAQRRQRRVSRGVSCQFHLNRCPFQVQSDNKTKQWTKCRSSGEETWGWHQSWAF